MIDVHLIGYTADLRYVVLDLDAEADGRYRLLIDGDLLATLQEVHELRIDAGLVVPGTPPPGVTSAELDDDGDVEVDDADEATDDDEAIAETDDLEDDDEDEEHEDEDEEHDDEDEEDDDEETFSADAAPSPIPLLRDAAESLERDVAAATEAAGAPLSFIDAHLETDPFEDRIDDRSPFAPPRDAGVGVRIVPRPAEPPPTASLFDEHEVDDEDDEDDELVPSAPRDVGAQTEPEVAEPDAAQPEVAQPEVAEPVVAEATARAPEPRPRPAASEAPAPRRSPSPRQRRSPAPPPEPQLSPAEIQALLRSGKSPRVVAEQAGTDEAWIERWLAPILEERARILRDAQSSKLQRPRLGRSRDALGDAVRKSLKRRNVDPDEAAWETSRRTDGRWRVTVRFRHRGKSRTASWVFDPRDRELDAASDLARDLGFTRGRDGAAAKKAAAKGRGSGRAKGGSKRR